MNKRTLAICAVLLSAVVASAAALTFSTLSKVTAEANVAVQLTTTSTEVLGVTFIGMKAARTNNTGTVYVQVTNTTNAIGYPIAPGQTLTISGDPTGYQGRYAPVNLTNFWIEAPNAGDGVQVVYIQYLY